MDKSVRNAILLAASVSVFGGCNAEETKPKSSETKLEQRFSKRLDALQKISGWSELKQLWQTLDAIAPSDSTNFGGPYVGTLTADASAAHFKTLANIKKLLGYSDAQGSAVSTKEQDDSALIRKKREGVLSDLEVSLLCELIEYRIDMFTIGPQSMFTRMVISPGSPMLNKEKSVVALEKQVDLLLSLKADKRISSDEYAKALLNLQGQIHLFAVNALIQKWYPWNNELHIGGLLSEDGAIKTVNTARFDSEIERIQALLAKPDNTAENKKLYLDMEKKYLETKAKLKEFDEALPRFQELVKELQR